MPKRTDAARRASLRLLDLERERDRLEHELALLQIELAGIVRDPGGGGWAEPRAVALTERIRERTAELDHVFDRVREERTALCALKTEVTV